MVSENTAFLVGRRYIIVERMYLKSGVLTAVFSAGDGWKWQWVRSHGCIYGPRGCLCNEANSADGTYNAVAIGHR